MGVITGTFKTYESKGNREQLENIIYDISPTETPFMNRAGRGDAKATLFDWQVDALDSASTTNAQLEGDDVDTFQSVTPTVRLGNHVQILRKTVIIADTQEVIDKAGRKSEIGYQVAKRGKELKRDIESTLLTNQAANAGSASVARKTASILAFVKTNVSKASDGVNPVYTTLANDDRTDGTLRTFTEDMLKDVIQQCWNSGANPSVLMVGGLIKQAVSGFDGIAAITQNQSGAKTAVIVGAADVYVSDFGNLTVVPNRFQRARDAHVLDFEFVSVDYLRPIKQVPLAKTGDAEKRMLITELGLRVRNEKALGLVADIQP